MRPYFWRVSEENWGYGWGVGHYVSRCFVCYFWFVGWDCLSLGLHVCWSAPNIEIHVPFGFFRIGRHPQ